MPLGGGTDSRRLWKDAVAMEAVAEAVAVDPASRSVVDRFQTDRSRTAFEELQWVELPFPGGCDVSGPELGDGR